jgi:LEA14-like dessication related protein
LKIQVKLSSFAIIFLFVLSSCTNFEEIKYKGIKSFSLKEFSKDGILLDVVITIDNPNSLSFSVVDTDMDFYLNDTYAGKAVLLNKIKIDSNSEKDYTVNLKADLKNFGGSLLPVFMQAMFKKTVKVTTKGTVTGKSLLFKKSFAVDASKDLSL